MAASNPLVSVIIVNYFSKQLTAMAVASLPTRDIEVIVVDNSSPNEDLSELSARPYVKVIRSPHNGGFGFGCNLGAKQASGKYLLFMNPDVRVKPDTLAVLLGQMQAHPRWGALGCKLTFEDGRLQYSAHYSYPTLLSHLYEYAPALGIIGPHLPYLKDRLYSPTLLSAEQHSHDMPVAHLLGALIMIPRNVFEEAGGFDEGFFLYREETDLLQRIQHGRSKIHYTATTDATHISGATTGNAAFASLDERYTASAYRYIRKHHGIAYTLVAWVLAMLGLAASLPIAAAAWITAKLLGKNGGMFRVATSKILSCMAWHILNLPQLLARPRSVRSIL